MTSTTFAVPVGSVSLQHSFLRVTSLYALPRILLPGIDSRLCPTRVAKRAIVVIRRTASQSCGDQIMCIVAESCRARQ